MTEAEMEVDIDSDDDPITSSYDIFIKPQIADGRQVYIIQFPNRDIEQRYSGATDSQPSKFRIKPNSGMVEMDVPIDARRNYDKDKGVKWGDAIKKSNMVKGGGSHGLPGGFGIGGAHATGRGRGRGEELDPQRVMEDYEGAIQREQVLVKQTLGGQIIPVEKTSPQYFVGAFDRVAFLMSNLTPDKLHLTPVDHIVQLRPQFHHIDAHAEQERQGRPRDPGTVPRTTEARAIHMTVKSNIDGEEDMVDNIGVRIAAAQQEQWQKHRYVDEDNQQAWDAFEDHLFVVADKDENGNPQELSPDTVPKLISGLDDMAYIDSISAPNNASKLSRSKLDEETVTLSDSDEE
ncbi:dna-directed RNA polymerase iii complex subunit rpc37 protein [Rutstroemia sp. NJR-2017a WRK4]|nr:dna-directed RNA polymerase iii complex subunit rpc37 protein [Rutstroemia sp. NJR-2017a WRK4]